jgi:hypothetical protein
LAVAFTLLATLRLATLLLATPLLAATAGAAEDEPPVKSPAAAASPEQIIDEFVKSCQENKDLSDARRQEVLALVAARRAQPDSSQQAITDALCAVSAEFQEALSALGDENTRGAIERLEKLSASGNRFLAADAAFFLARAYILEERYEESLPLLTDVTGGKFAGHTLNTPEALFLKGVSQAKLLKRKEAIQTLQAFREQSAAAPERLRVGAEHLLDELRSLEKGSIVDVEGRMDYSRRRLTLERSDQPTQREQKTIVAMLDKLIEAAEEKEKSGGGGGGGGKGKGRGRQGGKGGQNPAGGATQSAAGAGKAETGPLHRVPRGKPEDTWGGLKDKQRDEVLSALKARFPDRYKQLIEQYYKSLQDEDK